MTEKLSRRLMILRVATIAAAGSTVAACVPAQTGPYYAPVMVAPVRGRTGITDSDPGDGVGSGRGGYGGGSQGNRFRTGMTDADPSDGAGFGRGGRRGGTGLTDSDPSDGVGNGRGGYRGGFRGNRVRTGMTDSDPSDGAGHGRGRWR